MIPIAVLRKTVETHEETSGGNEGGIMQLITGTNSRVAPAADGNSDSSTTVDAAVLMLIPKKPDAVCLDVPGEANQDTENNPIELAQEVQQGSAQATSQSENVAVKHTASCDSYEEVCRICHDNPSKLELISPCLCKGSMSKVHRSCLERWLGESGKNSCEICGYEYNTVRKPKYTGCRSVYQWIRHPLSPSDTRNLFFDIACFFILTPLAAISSWLCVVGAQHYTFGEERRRRVKYHDSSWVVNSRSDPRADASNATWTSVGLLSLTGTLLVAYSVWLFVAIKYHIQAWRDWQQRNFTVTIVPFEDGCMGRPPVPRAARPNQHMNANNNSPLGERSSSNNNNNNDLLFYDHYGRSASDYNDEIGVNPSSYLRYTGHNSVSTRGRGRSLIRQGRRSRPRETYLNLPPIFSRSHFLRNPPPGYTISETALLYQALYGNESDTYLNENFLAFFADSSEDVTEASSMMVAAVPPQTIETGMEQQACTTNDGEQAQVTKSALGIQITSSMKDVTETPNNNDNQSPSPPPSQVVEYPESGPVQPQQSKTGLPLNGINANDTVITINENNVESNRNAFDLNNESEIV